MSKLQRFDPMKARGIRTLGTILEERGVKPPQSKPTGRDADPRRTIPLNSSRWQKLRARVLAEQPLCAMCDQPANVVDHANGNPGDNSRRNLTALCEPCHNHKTQRQRAGLPVVHGHDENGMPRDPGHPWNVERGTEKSPEGEPTQTARPPSLQSNGQD